MDDGRLDALQKLPALKGAALSIMVAMLIAQRPLQAKELESFTGYSNQAITRGLGKLGHFRAIVNLGRGRGYTLTPFWQQMMLPLEFGLNHENHDLAGISPQENHENHDLGPPINGGGGRSGSDRDRPPTNHGAAGDHENHDLPGDNSAGSGDGTPRQNAPEITARSGSPEITTVARWLRKAGISPSSHHWEKILSRGHKVRYVKAHVLELLASEEGIPGADEIKTGALIYRLEHRWRAPAMRCESCLYVASSCRCDGGIPPEYRDLVQR